jgi:hypothetical protein
MQYQLPDAVNFRQRFSRRRRGVHILQELQQSGTMPGVPFKGAAKLIGKEGRFGGCGTHIFRILFPNL